MTEPLKCTIADLADQLPNPFRSAKVIGANIRPEVYLRQGSARGQADYVMSRSDLMEFAHCPSRWLAGIEADETKATEWGTLIDGLVLDSENFRRRFAVTPEQYSGKAGPKPWNWNATECKNWRFAMEEAGLTVVKHSDYTKAEEAVSRLLGEDDINELLHGQKQVMCIGEFEDADTGLVIPVKCLIDIAPTINGEFNQSLADLKTCCDASSKAWARAVFDRDYHTQAAMHLDLYNAATGEQRQEFRHILQENYPPYQTAKRLLSSEFVSMGRSKYVNALKFYAKCLKENSWPDYDQMSRQIDGWAITEPDVHMISRGEI